MKKVWKWILGIVIALIVVAALVGGFLMMRNYRMTTFAQRYRQYSQVPNRTPVPNGQNGQSNPNGQNAPTNPNAPNRPMMGRGFGYGRGPMMMGRGFGYSPMMRGGGYGYGSMMMHRGFGFFQFFFRLAELAVFGLLLFGAYWLGRRSVTPVAAPLAPAPVSDPEPAPQRGRKAAKS